MSYRVRFRADAAADVRAAYHWYEAQRPGLGQEFEQALDADLALLREAPQAFPVVLRDVRRLLLRRFPYALYFRPTDEGISIVAVLHLRQHPRRWRRRT